MNSALKQPFAEEKFFLSQVASNSEGKLHNDTLREVKLAMKFIGNTDKQDLCTVENPELSWQELNLLFGSGLEGQF